MSADLQKQAMLLLKQEVKTLETLAKKSVKSEKKNDKKGKKGWAGFLDGSQREHAIAELEKKKNLWAMMEWCDSWIPFEVPADGNCGIWSTLTLTNNNPESTMSDMESLTEECRRMRQLVAQEWEDLAKDSFWQSLFMRLVALFDDGADSDSNSDGSLPDKPRIEPGPAVKKESQDSEKVSKSAKPAKAKACQDTAQKKDQESASSGPAQPVQANQEGDRAKLEAKTPKRKKPNPTIFVDLTTPPKITVGAACGTRRKRDTSLDGVVLGKKSAVAAAEERTQNLRKKLAENQAIFFGQSEDQTKTPAEEKDPSNEAEDEEQAETTQKKKKRAKRNRRFHKKPPCEESMRLLAARGYLGKLRITWAYCQAFHASVRHKSADSAEAVSNSGKCNTFALLPALLLEGKEVPCSVCAVMLKKAGFSAEEFQKHTTPSEEGGIFMSPNRMLQMEMQDIKPLAPEITQPSVTEPLPPVDVEALDPDQLQIVPYTGNPLASGDAPEEDLPTQSVPLLMLDTVVTVYILVGLHVLHLVVNRFWCCLIL